MCDTSVQDAQIVRITEQIATLNAEKATLTAIHSPKAEIISTINTIDGKIQRLYLRLSNINTTKSQLVSAYNMNCMCRNAIVGYGSDVVQIYDSHNS